MENASNHMRNKERNEIHDPMKANDCRVIIVVFMAIINQWVYAITSVDLAAAAAATVRGTVAMQAAD